MIVTYTGEEASVVFNALFSKYCDASKGEHIDMVKVSIIDPLKLVHAALIIVSRTQPSYRHGQGEYCQPAKACTCSPHRCL